LLTTKSEVNELLASSSVSYALICKDALISLHNMQQSMPPIVANILQEYAVVFPSEVPAGLPPLRGIEHQIDLILGASLLNRAPYRKSEITLKGGYLLTTKSEVYELLASNSASNALISLHDMQQSLPPIVANILQECADVFPSEVPMGLPPL
jgi:hypothetical protein